MSNFKYCIVPACRNTTKITPSKIFFEVPRKTEIRKMWCTAMRRTKPHYAPLSEYSTRHCCEDHFNLEEDTENFMKYKLMNSIEGYKVTLRLKKDVFPHIFPWKPEAKRVSMAIIKRRRMETIEEALRAHNQYTPAPIAAVEEPNLTITTENDPPATIAAVEEPKLIITTEKGMSPTRTTTSSATQVKPKYRSKGIVVKPHCATVALSPISSRPSKDAATATTPFQVTDQLDETFLSSPSKQGSIYSMEYVPKPETSDSECSWSAKEEDTQLKNQMRSGFLKLIERDPKKLLGIPKTSYYLIDYLVKNTKAPALYIMITLKKIKLNDSFSILALHFGYSESTISRIFSRTIVLLANALRSLIIWPPKAKVVSHLPIAFRARYAEVYAIIDCLEIEIQKPTNALHQSLSWSQYKGCNTAKYLLACTPDGLITFVSEGYGGRASDLTIVEDCGFLEKLPQKVHVMADRGFKNIAHLLQQKNCTLVRPPSVSTSSPSTKEEVMLSKQIAALRIHVERVIGRIREFHLLKPHSRIDHQLTPVLDYIILTACGLINMQNSLTKI